MIAYLIILAASIAGYAGAPIWSIAIAAPALALCSVVKYRTAYMQASRLGTLAGETALSTLLQSFAHAAVATSGAFLMGVLLRFIG